jgi:hypothetical protein
MHLKNSILDPQNIIRIHTGRLYLYYLLKDPFIQNHPLSEYSEKSYFKVFGRFKKKMNQNIDTVLDNLEILTLNRWMPIQKRIAIRMGETRIPYREDYFMTEDLIKNVTRLAKPGDIMVQRKNWHISNIGMPGFWTHSVFYTGTLEELEEYFSDTAPLILNETINEYIKKNYPEIYELKSSLTKEGYEYRTIEGKAPGIIILPMEESSKVDYLALLRPRLSKEEKLKALLFTFDNYLKPYDYNFDFRTDDEFVCSELIYKAYLPDSEKKGLNFTLEMIAGRYMLSPYSMVKQFDESFGSENQQLDLIIFLDGDESSGFAVEKDIEEFRSSWKRSKYDFMLIR